MAASALYVTQTIGLACALGKYHVLGYGVRFSRCIMVSGFPFGGEGTRHHGARGKDARVYGIEERISF